MVMIIATPYLEFKLRKVFNFMLPRGKFEVSSPVLAFLITW